MDQARVRPGDIRTAADISRIPLATKALLRASYPHDTVRPTGLRTYEACSSGSTGTNFCVKEDSETAGHYRACFILALQWAGWEFGTKHVQTGMTTRRSLDRRLKDIVLQCTYAPAFNLTTPALDAVLQTMETKRIRFLFGYPGSLYYLARRAAELGWNTPLTAAVTWGDNLYAHYRAAIESAFQTRVFDTYGIGEGVHIAAQCGTGQTYHVHNLDTIAEVIDDAGQPAPAGTQGRVVVTRLHPGPMPLIRYEVGDLATLSARRCECGRGFDVLEAIHGRDTDVVVTPAGNRLIVHFFTGVIEFFPEVDTFQVVQQDLQSITVRVVPTATWSPETAERIVRALHERGANGLRITVETVAEIPPTASGKRRFVISSVGRAMDTGRFASPAEPATHGESNG